MFRIFKVMLASFAVAALEVRAVLTPEQLARAAQTKERLTQLREEMRQLVQPPRP